MDQITGREPARPGGGHWAVTIYCVVDAADSTFPVSAYRDTAADVAANEVHFLIFFAFGSGIADTILFLVQGMALKLIEEGKYLHVPYILGANGDDMTAAAEGERTPENNPMHAANMAYAQMVEPDAYVYYFDRKLPGDDAGAFHSAELWYVFGSLKYCWRPLEEADFALSRKMITYWSSFMKSGDPNGGDGGPWRPCTKAEPYFEVLK